MNEKELNNLLQKILSGTASADDKQRVDNWYAKENAKDVVWESASPTEETDIEKRMHSRLLKHISPGRNAKTIYLRPLMRVAAVVAFIVCATIALFYFNRTNKIDGALKAPAGIAENRYLLLPDSSVVLLHPGSEISYDFNGKTRSLTLVGEAYFDIKHRTDKPFVIHTGSVTTTVLGTAFNIKAYSGQKVTVTVTRGKVSVADANKKLAAVLIPNQLVEVDEQTRAVAKKQVSARVAINWVKADMQFEELPFRELANRLERRYDVKFNFKNPALEQCPITGRFTGTESLQDVLNIISQTTAANCTIDGKLVDINGKGCAE